MDSIRRCRYRSAQTPSVRSNRDHEVPQNRLGSFEICHAMAITRNNLMKIKETGQREEVMAE